jgi:hypothetical protein
MIIGKSRRHSSDEVVHTRKSTNQPFESWLQLHVLQRYQPRCQDAEIVDLRICEDENISDRVLEDSPKEIPVIGLSRNANKAQCGQPNVSHSRTRIGTHR